MTYAGLFGDTCISALCCTGADVIVSPGVLFLLFKKNLHSSVFLKKQSLLCTPVSFGKKRPCSLVFRKTRLYVVLYF